MIRTMSKKKKKKAEALIIGCDRKEDRTQDLLKVHLKPLQ